MRVILLKDVPKVGQRNDIKEVKSGFAMNLLIPRGLAKQATPQTINALEKIKEREVLTKEADTKKIEEKVSKIKEVVIKAKANEKGHLFAGVGKEEISKETGIPVENINLEHPLKEVGEHEIFVSVAPTPQKNRVGVPTASLPDGKVGVGREGQKKIKVVVEAE